MDSGKTKSPNLKSNENAKTKMEDSAKTKGHCRSKSQTYSFTGKCFLCFIFHKKIRFRLR